MRTLLVSSMLLFAACERAHPEVQTFSPPEAVVDEPGMSATYVSMEDPAPVAPPVTVRPPSSATRWFLALSSGDQRGVRKVCRLQRENPCAGLLRPFGEDNPDPNGEFLAALGAEQQAPLGRYCSEVNRYSAKCNTPLVVSFDDDLDVAVSFVAPSPTATFAFTPGTQVATAWPASTTPWIALDRDGDGAITSGRELFGDATLLPDGTTAKNGFDALATLDANRDGVIDAHDPAFDSLLLWSDTNADRRSSPNELRALSSVVTSIPLAHRSNAARCTAGGNCEGERGALMYRTDGGSDRTGAVVDVYLAASAAARTTHPDM